MRPFERGAVGMALSGKDTGGSQFFITLSPQPHLDGGYTCFGRVISGMAAAEHMIAGDRITRVRIKEELSLLDYRDY
jgi:cyclophilin family peptidyl-prolyl cis-trans isomerase